MQCETSQGLPSSERAPFLPVWHLFSPSMAIARTQDAQQLLARARLLWDRWHEQSGLAKGHMSSAPSQFPPCGHQTPLWVADKSSAQPPSCPSTQPWQDGEGCVEGVITACEMEDSFCFPILMLELAEAQGM